MQGKDVYDVLKKIGVTHLHHANSVTTSCTFLEQGGLLSRGSVEDKKLAQTKQGSDAIDKKYGIWHRVFVDHVDIHDRGGKKKGPNQYGPVLFVFDLDALLRLPKGSNVLVTKVNPIYWKDKETDEDRYFLTPDDLAKVIKFGEFNKMLVIETPSGQVDFPNRTAKIVLDDPMRNISSGKDAYNYAYQQLTAAAKKGNVKLTIGKRACQYGCICVEKYSKYSPQQMDFWFTYLCS